MATEITLNDLVLAKEIIDVCAKRGAFQTSEFTAVGTLSDKLTAFIQEAKEAAEKEKNSDQLELPLAD